MRDLVGRPAVQRHPQGLSGRHNTPSVKGGKGGEEEVKREEGIENGGTKVTEATFGGVEKKGSQEGGSWMKKETK